MSVSAQYACALSKLLVALMPRAHDFRAFCIDSFYDIRRVFDDGMDTQHMLNLLIERQPDPARILDALREELDVDRERGVRRRVGLALEYMRDRKLRSQAVVWMLSRIATDENAELFAALEAVAQLFVNPGGRPQDLEPLDRWLKKGLLFTSSSADVEDHPSPNLEDWPVLILAWQALYAACEHVDDESVEMLASCLAVLLRRILPLGKKRAAIPRFPIETMVAVKLLLTRANERGTALHAMLTNLLVKLCVHNDRLAEALPILADIPESSGLLYASSQIAESWILRMRGHVEQAEDLLAKLLEELRESTVEPLHLWMSVALSLLLEIGCEEKLERAYPLASKYAGPSGQARFAYRLAEQYLEANHHERAAKWMEDAEEAASRAGDETLRQQSKLWRCNAAFQNKAPLAAYRTTLDELVVSFADHTENRHALGRTLQLRGQWRLRDHGHEDPEQVQGLEDLRDAEFHLRDSGYLDDANRVLAGWCYRLVARSNRQLENAQYAEARASLDRVVRATQHVAQMQPTYEAAKAADHFAEQGVLAKQYLAALRAGSEIAMLQVIKLALQLVSPTDAPPPILAPWLRLTVDIGVAIEAYANRDLVWPEYDLAVLAIELKESSDVSKKYKTLQTLCSTLEAVIEVPPEPASDTPH